MADGIFLADVLISQIFA